MNIYVNLICEYMYNELIFDLIISHADTSDRTHLICVSLLSSINLSSNYSNDCVNNYVAFAQFTMINGLFAIIILV